MTVTSKVLVVDDDPLQRLFVQRLLEKRYIVESAEDGEMALAILHRFRPNVVLLDIDMPKMDGLTACAKIRDDPSLVFVKIIIVSGRASLKDRMSGYEVGADDYLPKPVDEAELMAKVGIMMRLQNAEEIDQLKSTVLGLLSHETGTPLNGIMLASKLLMDKCCDNPELLRLVDIVKQSAERLGDFVDKAKFLCQLKVGVEPRLSEGVLPMQLQKAVEKGIVASGNKNISFIVDAAEEQVFSADWQLMDKVFDILIENAVKFSPNEGEIRIQSSRKEDTCVIEIIDNGKGLDSEWVDNIFNEFAIQDIMKHQRGTGLSLAIALRIVKLHGGTLQGVNRDEGGAVFTIVLPMQSAENQDSVSDQTAQR